MVIGLAAVTAGGYLGGLVAALTVQDLGSVNLGHLALVSLGGFLVFLVVGAVALVVASLVHTGGRAIGWAAGFALVSYAVNYLAQVWSVMEPLARSRCSTTTTPGRSSGPPGSRGGTCWCSRSRPRRWGSPRTCWSSGANSPPSLRP